MKQASVQAKLELAKLRKQLKQQKLLDFDGLVPGSRPTPAQDEILRDAENRVFWVLGSNRSGKTALGGRIVAWFFNNDHPYLKRPPEWGSGPIQILVVGRLLEQMESELFERKLKPLLNEADLQVVRIGGSLQRIIHRKNGNRIVFMSHHDALNAREKVQGFTSQVVWLDELPDHPSLITELIFRTLSSNGRFYGTFTPLLRNEEIRRIVETPAPYTRQCKLLILDNPAHKGREAEIEAQVRAVCASEDEFRSRMYGDWFRGDLRVVAYSRDRNLRPLPQHYHPMAWRHLALLDPAASGLAGLTIWGEDPQTGHWWCVFAKCLKGAAATELLERVEAELRPWHGPGLLRKTDCNPAGLYKEAARQGLAWIPYTDKNDRKLETLEKLNNALLEQRVWLTPAAVPLEDEFVKCSWSERDPNKIANASAYHLLDTARYAIDSFPRWDPKAQVALTPTQELRQAWKSRLKAQAKAQRVRVWQRRSPWKSA